jgi:hypothetical protein
LEEAAQARRRLAERWEALISQVRKLTGFEDFLRPKSASSLVAASRLGAIVIINVDALRCNALILRDGSQEISHVYLASASHQKLHTAHTSLMKILSSSGLRQRAPVAGDSLYKDFISPDHNESE